MPFNYLSTVINIEPDTQPEERGGGREGESHGKRKGEKTTEGAQPKLALLKGHLTSNRALNFPVIG